MNEEKLSEIRNDFDAWTTSIDKIDFNKIHSWLLEFGSEKGLNLWEKADESLSKLEVAEANLGNRGNYLDDPNYIVNTTILITEVLTCSYYFMIRLIELVQFVRTSEILTVIREIDFEKPIDKLNEIELKLNEFVEYNHLSSLNEFDFYPMSLISDAREQLNRISLNYGKWQINKNKVQNENIEEVEFPVDLFLKNENYQLFKYFIEHFAHSKRPVDLSQIYRWLEDEKKVKPRSGIEYRDFVLHQNLVVGKFAKITSKNPNSQTALNELYKKFTPKG